MARSPFQELSDRLRRSELLLLRAVRRQRSRPAVRAKGQFWGSVITDDEVDELLIAHGEIGAPAPDNLTDALLAAEALRDAPGGVLGRQRVRHALEGVDMDLLLLALMPDVAEGYARIFAYLNDNLNLPFLTVGLAARVLETRRPDRLAVMARLLPGGPLLRTGLLEVQPVNGLEYHATQRLIVSRALLTELLTAPREPQVRLVDEEDEGVIAFPEGPGTPRE